MMPRNSWASDKIPTMLDHILLGCSDLDQGIAFVEPFTQKIPEILIPAIGWYLAMSSAESSGCTGRA